MGKKSIDQISREWLGDRDDHIFSGGMHKRIRRSDVKRQIKERVREEYGAIPFMLIAQIIYYVWKVWRALQDGEETTAEYLRKGLIRARAG